MQSTSKRGGKRWDLCVFCSSSRFLIMQSLLKVSEYYPSLDGLLQLFTSVPRCNIFMVCFKFQSYLGLFRISSSRILNFCKGGGSTAPLGNLFQCSAALTVGFFFNTVFSSSSTLALNFLSVSCEGYISSFYYTLPKVWIWLLYINTLDSLRQQADPSLALLLHSEFASRCSSCYVIVQPPNCFDGAPRCLLSSSSAVLRGSTLDMALEL